MDCIVCGRTPPDGGRHLSTLDGRGMIDMCRACLHRRRIAHWSSTIGGQDVERALRHGHRSRRFSYLRDETGELHLVRLRPEWVASHASPTI